MDFNNSIAMIADIISIFAFVIGSVLAAYVFLQFNPVLDLRLTPRWIEDDSRWVVIRIEVENVSRVRVTKQLIHLQVLRYRYPPKNDCLSEWVPFEEKHIKQSEPPIDWQPPEPVFKSTLRIDPGESLSVERLYYCPPETVLKVGLQAEISFDFFGRSAARVRRWHHRWTTTAIIARDTTSTA